MEGIAVLLGFKNGLFQSNVLVSLTFHLSIWGFTSFYRVLPCFISFFFFGFSGFYLVPLIFTVLVFWVFLCFFSGTLGFTGFCLFLPSFLGFYWTWLIVLVASSLYLTEDGQDVDEGLEAASGLARTARHETQHGRHQANAVGDHGALDHLDQSIF